MPRFSFGAFLAPHHPIGELPMLQFRRDLDLVEHLRRPRVAVTAIVRIAAPAE